MSTHNIHFLEKYAISLKICLLELSEELCRDSKNEFELAMVNEEQFLLFSTIFFTCC